MLSCVPDIGRLAERSVVLVDNGLRTEWVLIVLNAIELKS